MKQLKTLIMWAKKYMDVDTTLKTEIENKEIVIKTEMVFNQLHLVVLINEEETRPYYLYDFDLMKWKTIKK